MPVYVWFSCLSGVTVGFSFMNIPPVAEQFMALFGVGYGGLSLFLSALLWTHSLFQVPAGLLVDRFTPFSTLCVSSLAGVAANFVPFLAPENLLLASLMRIVLGLCTGQVYLSALKIIGLIAPRDQTAKVQGYYGGLFSIGTVLPYFILPYLGSWGWICSYAVCGGMYFMVFLSLFFLPGSASAKVAKTADAIGLWRVFRTVITSPDVWALGAIHGICHSTLTNLGQWLPSILADIADSPIAGWTIATILVLLVGSFSRLFSGSFVRFASRRTLTMGMMWMSGVVYILLGLSRQPLLALALGLLLALVSGISYGPLMSIAARVLAPVYMATALGLFSTMANIVNAGLTILLGNFRERTGSFTGGLITAGVLSLVAWLLSRRFLIRIDRATE